jgi:hypothetical protein
MAKKQEVQAVALESDKKPPTAKPGFVVYSKLIGRKLRYKQVKANNKNGIAAHEKTGWTLADGKVAPKLKINPGNPSLADTGEGANDGEE